MSVFREISPESASVTFFTNPSMVSSYSSEIQFSPPSIPARVRTFTFLYTTTSVPAIAPMKMTSVRKMVRSFPPRLNVDFTIFYLICAPR